MKTLLFRRPTRDIVWLGWITLLALGVVAGIYAAIQVFIHGLVITNLTDQVPWGLWITVDLSAIALSGGAFFLSALVYIIGIERFKPAARLAVFVGLLGYSAALCTLLLDIGRPDRFYHPLLMWNTHSMLWEVTMCIVLYFSVLMLEVFPMLAELPLFAHFSVAQALGHRVHRFAPVLAFLGLGFSMLHQSSLGATYGVLAARPIWFRPTMPLLFIASAMATGPALTMALALIVGWLRRRPLIASNILFDVAKVSAAALLITLYMRFWDITAGTYGYVPLRSEATNLLTGGAMALTFWLWEIGLGSVAAAALMLWAAARRSEGLLFVGAGMAVIGLVVNRWNTTILGLTTPLSTAPTLTFPLTPTYSPALVEWAVAAGIVAGVTLAFTLGMKFLPAFASTE